MSRSALAPSAPSRPASASTTAAAAAPPRRLPRPAAGAPPPHPATGRLTLHRCRAPAGARPARGVVGTGRGAAAANQPRPRTLDGDSVVKPCIIMPRAFPPYGSTPGTLPPRVVNSVPPALVEALLLASPLYVTTHM